MMCIRIAKRIMKIQIKKLLLKAKEIMSIVALMKMVRLKKMEVQLTKMNVQVM